MNPATVRGLPGNGKFDIILHHLRFHKENLSKVLHDDTIYLTSMRNPLSHFVSTFEFFYGRFTSAEKMRQKSNKGQSLTCWGHPFVNFLGEMFEFIFLSFFSFLFFFNLFFTFVFSF